MGQSPKEKIEEETSADEMAAATEEAMAMAMILAGNGTLPNSRKKPRTEEWDEGEENDPKLVRMGKMINRIKHSTEFGQNTSKPINRHPNPH